MTTNQYVPFANGVGANTEPAATWIADSVRSLGFQPGLASATKVNTALRQTSVAAAALAQFAAEQSGDSLLDDGNVLNFKTALFSAVSLMLKALVPPGAVMDFAMSAAPAGWVEAAGQVVSQSGTFSNLFAAIGTTYNTGGEGGGNFRLPDYRGKFRRGWDHSRGVDPGRPFGSNQADALQNIVGTLSIISGGQGATGAFAANGAAVNHINTATTGTDPGITFDASRVSRTSPETRPVNVAVLTCIKL
jgi:microcystin-dependent protein